MDGKNPLPATYPTAGYLFAEELDAHFLALDDFHALLLQDDVAAFKVTAVDSSFAYLDATATASPSSPSSVVYVPPCYPPLDGVADNEPLIKQEHTPASTATVPLYPEPVFVAKPESKHAFRHYRMNHRLPRPVPVRVIRDDAISEEAKERLRRRQRGYEKRYRGRKRTDLKVQRDMWLSLEMQLDAARKAHCRPYSRVELGGRESLRCQLLLLKLEERALRQDQVAMRTLQAWEEISRIREYSDKDQLRTVSEWRHSADKVVGRCAGLGPRRFHPYAPVAQRHFTW
ncbi:hypothetical protein PHYPSEUDO_011482 [Phytophthora pseudosyringae]|uniref:Uncharacterized protein n=1 Tax=Phytophthora pseudosyringae TaxID=221518 RepID=A0A8T1V8E0_9STRA|nr:hypothetical protein PHYPSEUDO_011482 [Phytophthora pseudosyringae]